MLLQARQLRIPADDAESPLPGPIDLTLSAGDRVRLSGRSGSGKSTLLRCLAMLEARALGEIVYRGETITTNAVPGFRRQVMYIAQTPARFPMTVEDSLRKPLSFANSASSFDPTRAAALLDQLRLPSTILKRPLHQLSGGEAQRVALIRGLLLDPTILLLDEITSGLDSQATASVLETLESWFAAGNRASIAVTHGASIWGEATNRTLTIVDGRATEETER